MKNSIGIIGLGYVGLPLAYLAASKSYKVIGIDNDQNKIDYINNRNKVPKQIENKIKNMDLIATSNYKKLNECEIIIVCVPTPTKNNKPDLSILSNVIEELAKTINKHFTLVIESTIAPGMTKKYVEDKLKKYGNLEIDKDYELAYCPERIDPGNKKYWVGNINRVVGSNSKKTLEKVSSFYQSIIDAEIVKMNSIEEAELVKVWENSIRNIFIAQSNLLAKICDETNMSVKNIINGLNSKVQQFPLNIASPGLGPGGHCIPEDIHYLIDSLNDKTVNTNLFKESIIINESMPKYALDKLQKITAYNNDDLKALNILLLGISYKPNSDDIRKSQALVLYNLIKEINNKIVYYDPIADKKEISKLEELLKSSDIVIIGCSHDIFLNIDFSKYNNIKYLFDCWNKYNKEDIQKLGITYIGIGE